MRDLTEKLALARQGGEGAQGGTAPGKDSEGGAQCPGKRGQRPEVPQDTVIGAQAT